MQGDLISRSALIEEIESLTMQITGIRSGKGVLSECMKEYKKSILRIIEEQPTAYNVEKVVAELEEENQRLKKLKNNCIALSDHEVCDIENKAYNFAIKCVRNGWKE